MASQNLYLFAGTVAENIRYGRADATDAEVVAAVRSATAHDFILLDEATSALEADSERLVQAALTDLARGRTTLVIAHRLSTIRHADRILILTERGIAEKGSHDELMRRGGVHAALQAGQAIE